MPPMYILLAMYTRQVHQLWPPELFDAVREKVGARGVTAFTIAAVQAALEDDAPKPPHVPRPRMSRPAATAPPRPKPAPGPVEGTLCEKHTRFVPAGHKCPLC